MGVAAGTAHATRDEDRAIPEGDADVSSARGEHRCGGFQRAIISKNCAIAMGLALGAAILVRPVTKERPSARRAEQLANGAAETCVAAPVSRPAKRNHPRRIGLDSINSPIQCAVTRV
jgi:hypothetical protein